MVSMVGNVPVEVLQKIFAELDESTLFNASLTCQLWMDKLSPRLPSLHHLHIDLDSLSCDGRILYRNVRDTSTTLCQCHEHAIDQGVFLREICQRFGDRLSSVVVEDCLLYKSEKESINDYSILVILRECGESLKRLEFHLLNLRRVRLWTLVIMARFSALSAVHFESCEFPAMLSESIFTRMLAPSFHALETISITNNKLISDKFTLSVAKYCVNLRELNVAGCPKVTALTVVGFCECLPQRRDSACPVDLNLQNTLFNASELSRHLYNPLLSCGPCWKAQPITVTIGYDRSAIVLGNVDRSDLVILIYV